MDAINQRFTQAAAQFDHWLTQQLFPLWCQQGLAASGAAIEQFTPDGIPDLQRDKRLLVQARQIFTFCYGKQIGAAPDAAAKVNGINDFISQVCTGSLPGFYPMSVTANDEIKNPHTDLYDIAFFLFAYAWQKRAFNDDSAISKAKALTAKMNQALQSEYGGWQEGTYTFSSRRQNPHMHLFEAFLALYENTQDNEWLKQAEHVFALFQTAFFDEKFGVLREYFTMNWSICAVNGDSVEPGHMMEWVWLLHRYQKLSGADVSDYCDVLYQHGKKYGLQQGSKWLVDTVKPDGSEPSLSCKCWPMTEWIKAALVMHQRHPGEPAYLQDAAYAITELMNGFKHPERANQYVYSIDVSGAVLDGKMAASTMYHLCMAHDEIQRGLTE